MLRSSTDCQDFVNRQHVDHLASFAVWSADVAMASCAQLTSHKLAASCRQYFLIARILFLALLRRGNYVYEVWTPFVSEPYVIVSVPTSGDHVRLQEVKEQLAQASAQPICLQIAIVDDASRPVTALVTPAKRPARQDFARELCIVLSASLSVTGLTGR